MFLCEVDRGCFVSQVDQEERSGPVEEEGSTEAARWAPLFRQRPEGGERSPRCFLLSAHFHTDWLPELCCLASFCMTCYLTLLPPSCLLSHPSFSHLWSLVFLVFFFVFLLHLSLALIARTLSACRVFVSGAAAPAVSWLLLALAVLQALSKVGDCGCGMCW